MKSYRVSWYPYHPTRCQEIHIIQQGVLKSMKSYRVSRNTYYPTGCPQIHLRNYLFLKISRLYMKFNSFKTIKYIVLNLLCFNDQYVTLYITHLYAISLAPKPIRVKSCVCCLFWTNRKCMTVTSIFLFISLSN